MTEQEVRNHLENGGSIKIKNNLFYWIIMDKLHCSSVDKKVGASESFYNNIEEIFTENTLDEIELVGKTTKNTGLSTNYYKLEITKPANLPDPYTCECQDIIERLGMSFNEGEAFKALWRKAARRTLGLTKEGVDGLYDAEKIKYFGERVYEQEKNNG